MKTTENNHGVECPHCGHVRDDDLWDLKEYDQRSACEECGGGFVHRVERSVKYVATAPDGAA